MKNEARLLGLLSLKGLTVTSAKLSKLSSQGFSSEVYSFDSAEESFILKLYRDRSEKAASKEKTIYRFLSNGGVPVPKVYLADVRGTVLGRPFLLMQRIEKQELHSTAKEKDFIEALALSLHKLHSVDIGKLSLDLPRRGFSEEVSDIKTVVAVLLTFSMAPITFFRAYRALSEISNLPVQGNRLALLHGDCGLDNLIYSNGIVYLIDLEGAYIGDPAFDVGYAFHSIKLWARSKPELADHLIEAYENLHGKVAGLEAYKRLAALKIAVLLRFLKPFNPLSFVLTGFKRTADLLDVRRFLSAAFNYCLAYAEEGTVESNNVR